MWSQINMREPDWELHWNRESIDKVLSYATCRKKYYFFKKKVGSFVIYLRGEKKKSLKDLCVWLHVALNSFA